VPDDAPVPAIPRDAISNFVTEADDAMTWPHVIDAGPRDLLPDQAAGSFVVECQVLGTPINAATGVALQNIGQGAAPADVLQGVRARLQAAKSAIDLIIRDHGRQLPPWENDSKPPEQLPRPTAKMRAEAEWIELQRNLQVADEQLRLLQTLQPASQLAATTSVPQEPSSAPAPLLPRPSEPTLEYCLPQERVIRWEGTTTVRPKLWLLLRALLSAPGCRITLRQVARDVYGQRIKSERSVRNNLTELNRALDEVKFPLTMSMTGERREKVLKAVGITRKSQGNHH
jgi:hypothetical protein